mgnify:CR=1 FL=1
MTIFHNNTQTKPQPDANDSYKGTVMKFIAVSSLFIPITAFSLRILMSIRPIVTWSMLPKRSYGPSEPPPMKPNINLSPYHRWMSRLMILLVLLMSIDSTIAAVIVDLFFLSPFGAVFHTYLGLYSEFWGNEDISTLTVPRRVYYLGGLV